MEMYPSVNPQSKGYPLQSILFGHRIKPNQTKYEYLIEFLQVALAKKMRMKTDALIPDTMFPIEDAPDGKFTYLPHTDIALKRFIFFPKSKLDGKAKVDEDAYNALIAGLEERTLDHGAESGQILMIQNLLRGFCAVNQSRSWFGQNLLPICPEVILPEGMGVKGMRQKIKGFDVEDKRIDEDFDYHRYTYMCRGGEVYYLHLLNALVEYPDYKSAIENGLSKMITSFPSISCVCRFIENTWKACYIASAEQKPVSKDFGSIPPAFSKRNKYTVIELKNFLSGKSHPFEKLNILACGMILQIMRMMYLAAVPEGEPDSWVIDVNCAGHENAEAKKCAINAFKHNEEVFTTCLYDGLREYRDILVEKDEQKVIRDAAEDSYKLFRKLGKMIGVIIPMTGTGMRFTLSEDIIKFLVLSIIPPKHMITLDEFVKRLYEHFGMIIGPEQFNERSAGGDSSSARDSSFMEYNLSAFSQKLKDCGFLRDLSDATSIVENPYSEEADK